MASSVLPYLPTYPAPFVLALLASHMLASCVFLNRHPAPRTSLNRGVLRPFLKELLLSLPAAFAFVPRHEALKAELLLALLALYPLCILPRSHYHYIVALGVGTKLSVFALHDFLLHTEPHELLVRIFISHLLDEFFRHLLPTPLLRTLDAQSFPPTLCDLKGQEVSITFLAEAVSA